MDDIVRWTPGKAPIAVVMLSLNEEHNMEEVCRNLSGWAQQVFLVDSFSKDGTVDIALKHGVHVVQRPFRNFGDQWNFALRELPVTAPWTMKLDPDERISEELKRNLIEATGSRDVQGVRMYRRWWLMGSPLPMGDEVIRLWRTHACEFSDVEVNEHPKVQGPVVKAEGCLEHLDSPDLDHWFEKQNRYTTAEAVIAYRGDPLADSPSLFGDRLQRRMWLKRNFHRVPLRFTLLFMYYWIWKGMWKSGRVGYMSARLWTDVMRFREYKLREMRMRGGIPPRRSYGAGSPDVRVPQYP